MPAALRIAALTLLTGLAAGCFTVGHLAFVTTRNGPSASGSDPRHVRGQSCVPLIVVFPAGPLPNLGDAVEAALRAGEGRAMRNVVVQFVYGLRAEATRLPNAPAENPILVSAFGRSTSSWPTDFRITPRVGFTYLFWSDAGLPTGAIRGGIGGPGGGRP